jgi:hypothetical protein
MLVPFSWSALPEISGTALRLTKDTHVPHHVCSCANAPEAFVTLAAYRDLLVGESPSEFP